MIFSILMSLSIHSTLLVLPPIRFHVAFAVLFIAILVTYCGCFSTSLCLLDLIIQILIMATNNLDFSTSWQDPILTIEILFMIKNTINLSKNGIIVIEFIIGNNWCHYGEHSIKNQAWISFISNCNTENFVSFLNCSKTYCPIPLLTLFLNLIDLTKQETMNV